MREYLTDAAVLLAALLGGVALGLAAGRAVVG